MPSVQAFPGHLPKDVIYKIKEKSPHRKRPFLLNYIQKCAINVNHFENNKFFSSNILNLNNANVKLFLKLNKTNT